MFIVASGLETARIYLQPTIYYDANAHVTRLTIIVINSITSGPGVFRLAANSYSTNARVIYDENSHTSNIAVFFVFFLEK